MQMLQKVIEESLKQAKIKFSDIDAVAATTGPGLIGGLIVGAMTGKTIASVIKNRFLQSIIWKLMH